MIYRFNTYEKQNIKQGHLRLGGTSLNGDSIDVNSLYITLNNTPWIGVMGEFHFSRYNKKYWREELSKIKAGGVNIVSTYLFWIYHEETEGIFDFSGDRDIRTFVELCREEDLYVFLRIGPWSHGECRNGGFPDWLIDKNIPLRQNSPEYLTKVQIFFEKIFEQVRGLMFSDGGNVIGIQLENELGDNPEYLLRLKIMAKDIGFDVPLYTVTGWNCIEGARIPVDEVIPVFGGYPEAPWAQHINKLPLSEHYVFNTMRNDTAIGCDIIEQTAEDGWRLPYELYPYATCELGGGMQATHHRRPYIKAMDIYAISLVKLGSGNNLIGYYMYHGGTHKIGQYSTLQESTKTGYPNDYPIRSYDFQSPISEYGEIREHYRLLNMLHLFVEDYGNILAPMQTVTSTRTPSADEKTSLRYCMRTDGNSGFVFINHYQRLAALDDIDNVIIDTGNIQFPEISVKGEISFIMPFNIELGNETLLYATAQPICRQGNTYFFASVPGICPEYKFKNGCSYKVDNNIEHISEICGIKIVTLPWETSKYLRRIKGSVYIGNDCDLYMLDGKITAAGIKDFSYRKYLSGKFRTAEVKRGNSQARLKTEKIEKPPFQPKYEYELNYGGKREIQWYKISVSSPYGFVDIDYIGDTAQIYINGELTADDFYNGRVWRISAELLYNNECCLAVSELKDDFYREF